MPTPPVPGVNEVFDLIMASDDEIDAQDDPLANDLADTKISVEPVDLSYYRYEEGNIISEQMAGRYSRCATTKQPCRKFGYYDVCAVIRLPE